MGFVMLDIKNRRKRIENALWGLFIGDALAMPAHWYYNPDNIKKDFNGGIKTFEAARHPHPESFMVGMGYHPDVETAIAYSRQVRLPKVSGKELFALYRDHQGPGNIPSQKMWRLHTRLADEPMDIPTLLDTYPQEDLTRIRLC